MTDRSRVAGKIDDERLFRELLKFEVVERSACDDLNFRAVLMKLLHNISSLL